MLKLIMYFVAATVTCSCGAGEVRVINCTTNPVALLFDSGGSFWFNPGRTVLELPDGGYTCGGVAFGVGTTNTSAATVLVGSAGVAVYEEKTWWDWFLRGFEFGLVPAGFALTLRVVRGIGRPSPEL